MQEYLLFMTAYLVASAFTVAGFVWLSTKIDKISNDKGDQDDT
jgi:hypothetical protein